MMEEKEFNFNKFWGDPQIESHVVFKRKMKIYCVYCGNVADTREHCPSRAFLKKPLPTDLPTVPACKKCNNGFSSDERYTMKMIEFLNNKYYRNMDNSFLISKGDDDSDTEAARKNTLQFVKAPYFDDRMANVFRKLAICHAAYEISVGYYSDDWCGKPERISYTLKSLLDEKKWDNLEYAEVISEDALPEIGSRVFRNIYVVQVALKSVDNGETKMLPICMLDWTDVQDGYYKYQVFMRDDKIFVKMIFRDFLYAEVVFAR